MACERCGARKGHLDGCPLAPGSKRGGKQPPKEREKDRGQFRTPLCLQTTGGSNEPEHLGIRHLCQYKKNHSGKHQCAACPKTW